MSAHPGRQVGHWHMRDRDPEKLRPPKDRMQRDESAVAPADDSEPVEIRVAHQVAQIRARLEYVIHFLSAVVYRVKKVLTVTRASSILRRDDYISLSHQRANVRHVHIAQIAVDSIVNKNESRVLAKRVLRREEIRRNWKL